MTSRYDNRFAAVNTAKMYKSLFKRRGVKFIKQFRTPRMHFPTDNQMASLRDIDYIWKLGDRFFKLADKFYGDPTLWWIIAWYNQKPTESHLKTGEVIMIPQPLDAILPIFMQGS